MHILSLVGEQPIPSLTILRFLKPSSLTLIYTDRSREVANRVAELLKADHKWTLEVPAYQLVEIRDRLTRHVEEIKRNLGEEKVSFDLTGGTKPMAFAAYDIARSNMAHVYYLRSQKESVLFEYKFTTKGLEHVTTTAIRDALFDLEDYLHAYLGRTFKITGPCRDEPGRSFELAVIETLKGVVDELKSGVRFGGALDLDLVLRLKTKVGVAELKTGGKAKEKRPLEQVNAACGRAFLGTYTKKLLIVDREIGPNLHSLAEAWNVKVIELPSFGERQELSPEDKEKLKAEVCRHLGG